MTTPDNYVETIEHFGSMSHEQIYAVVQSMDPEALVRAQTTWRTVADALSAARAACQTEVAAAISQGWTGAAADAAQASLAAFGTQGHRAEEMMSSVEARLAQAAHAAEAMRTAVPPPPTTLNITPDSILDPTHAAHVAAHHKSTEQARQQAIRVMTAVYGPVFAASGDAAPTFAPTSDNPTSHHEDQSPPDVAPAISGLGMGMIGALAGIAATGGDTSRPAPTLPRPTTTTDEPEHVTPTYLVEMDQGNPLIGHQPPVSPPVLGVWAAED